MVKGASLRRESICQTVEALGVEGFTDDPEVLVTAKFGILEAICAHRALRPRGPIRPEVLGEMGLQEVSEGLFVPVDRVVVGKQGVSALGIVSQVVILK